jgi:hypothetical protein
MYPQLETINSVVADDFVPIYQSSNSSARKSSFGVVKEFINPHENSASVTINSEINEDSSVSLPLTGQNIWLIVGSNGYELTVVFPMPLSSVDNQIILITLLDTTDLVIQGIVAEDPSGTYQEGSSLRFKYNKYEAVWLPISLYRPE